MENLERIKNFKETNEIKIKNGEKNSTNNSLLNSKFQTPNSHLSTPTSHCSGITLIALVVTIVILLILAAVTINLVLAEGGLFERAQNAEEEHEKSAAREELELKLADMQAEKLVNNRNYTEGKKDYEYLSTELWEEGYIVNGDIVTVDDKWQFIIDRSVPKIASYFGKGEKDDSITIECSEVTEKPYTFSTITVKITSGEDIQSIIFNGENILELIDKDENYSVDTEGNYIIKVTENKIYNIYVQNVGEKYNNAKIEVNKITEDMDIWNKEDLVAFREKVNEGRTFEGRTVKVMADIDLNKGKYTVAEDATVTFTSDAEQWIPIANYAADNTLTFKGTFEGNNHTISGVYINNSSSYQGLFGKNEGIIQGITINGKIITTGLYVGGIVGENNNIILNCQNTAYIKGYNAVGGLSGGDNSINSFVGYSSNSGEIFATLQNAGGIRGFTRYGSMIGCYNSGYIHAGTAGAGGIIGHQYSGIISNCFNEGSVYSPDGAGGITGVSGQAGYSTGYKYNCYNLGTITGSVHVGQLTGLMYNSQNINCYTTDATAELLNANDYSKDENGEYVWTNDIQNLDGTWKYNNGYPILKWQVKQ